MVGSVIRTSLRCGARIARPSRSSTPNPKVQAIFVNIFGGITRVDEVAKGVLEALARVNITSPIVLRLDGTNAVEGLSLIHI